ncbi:hypothetical protein WJX82_008497 [Trebouxia sp. C0006]
MHSQQVFQLRHQPTAATTLHKGQGSVLLKEDQGCHLEKILLAGFKCSSIDLRSSVSLLQVTITNIDTIIDPALSWMLSQTRMMSFFLHILRQLMGFSISPLFV